MRHDESAFTNRPHNIPVGATGFVPYWTISAGPPEVDADFAESQRKYKATPPQRYTRSDRPGPVDYVVTNPCIDRWHMAHVNFFVSPAAKGHFGVTGGYEIGYVQSGTHKYDTEINGVSTQGHFNPSKLNAALRTV
jgi:hypothetical protein